MTRIPIRRYAVALLLGAALIAAPQAATAAAPAPDKLTVTVKGPPPDLPLTLLEAGKACPGFALTVKGTNSKTRTLEYRDQKGTLVRTVESGNGYNLTFTNAATGKSVFYKSDSIRTVSVYHKDGTRTVTSSGHFAIIMFPTDVPAGPSTTQYVGTVVYDATPTDDFTIKSVNAKSTDVCKQLKGGRPVS